MRPRFQPVQQFLPHQLGFDAARESDVDVPMDRDPGRVVDDPSLEARLAASLAELQSDGRMSASRRPLADPRTRSSQRRMPVQKRPRESNDPAVRAPGVHGVKTWDSIPSARRRRRRPRPPRSHPLRQRSDLRDRKGGIRPQALDAEGGEGDRRDPLHFDKERACGIGKVGFAPKRSTPKAERATAEIPSTSTRSEPAGSERWDSPPSARRRRRRGRPPRSPPLRQGASLRDRKGGIRPQALDAEGGEGDRRDPLHFDKERACERLAEGRGFEPLRDVNPCRFSRPMEVRRPAAGRRTQLNGAQGGGAFRASRRALRSSARVPIRGAQWIRNGENSRSI